MWNTCQLCITIILIINNPEVNKYGMTSKYPGLNYIKLLWDEYVMNARKSRSKIRFELGCLDELKI